MTNDSNTNDGKPWSDLDLTDLDTGLTRNLPLREIAKRLGRAGTVAQVGAVAKTRPRWQSYIEPG